MGKVGAAKIQEGMVETGKSIQGKMLEIMTQHSKWLDSLVGTTKIQDMIGDLSKDAMKNMSSKMHDLGYMTDDQYKRFLKEVGSPTGEAEENKRQKLLDKLKIVNQNVKTGNNKLLNYNQGTSGGQAALPQDSSSVKTEKIVTGGETFLATITTNVHFEKVYSPVTQRGRVPSSPADSTSKGRMQH